MRHMRLRIVIVLLCAGARTPVTRRHNLDRPHHPGRQAPRWNQHRTGIWIGNQKARRDRLDAAQRAALAELGVGWAR
ncbi:hypothetical protein [Streptomyces sp. NPDC058304]|uniref:hypothetical protein n=1 Tax=Streptomyces sp. NPDC058304 TaxID=3346437 RepID=UPI0036E1006F